MGWCNQQLPFSNGRTLDMTRYISIEAHSAELAIIISYAPSVSGRIVLLKRPQNIEN